jgi:hypothetical protein
MMPPMHMRNLLFVVVAACGGAGTKDVAVKGPDNELAKLAGDWAGDYKGIESGREGTVTFSLQMGSHTAEGEVVMGGTTPLKVEFVQVKSGEVKGTIAPYKDPNCSCEVETSFVGTLSGDTISGNFETKVSASGQTQTGSWQVTRKEK